MRQTFGGLQYVGTDAKPLIFLKEISSNQDIQTVDVIFPAIPLILYLTPKSVARLLDPLFMNQENGHYPNKWAIHDLGTFPVARGYPAGDGTCFQTRAISSNPPLAGDLLTLDQTSQCLWKNAVI